MNNTLSLFTDDEYDSNLIKEYFKSVYGADGTVENIKTFGFSYNEVAFKSTMVLLRNNQFENKGKKERHKWSVYLFTKINMQEYISVFKERKDCIKIDKIFDNNYLEYSVIQSGPYTGRKPNELQLLPEIFDLMQNCIFKTFLYHYSSLIINCNYYSILDFCMNNKSTRFTYQLNKNYALKNYNRGKKKKLQNGFSTVKDIEEEIAHITEKNRELSDLVDAYLGRLEFNEETEANYYDVQDAMLIKEKCILVEGYARTGKSIIALRLLHDYPEFDLLIMNHKFYHDLEKTFLVLGVEFPYDRIHHHSKKGKGSWDYSTRNGYLIVDEAQRLGNFDVDAIDIIFDAKNHKETILLGDNNQFINPKYDYGLTKIKEKLVEKEINVYSINFTESIGIPSNILKAIKKICYNDSFVDNYSLNNFNVESVNDINTFVDNYKNNPSTKKHMATIYMYDGEYYAGKVPGMTRYNMNYNSDDYFLENNYVTNYYFSTFEMISRQVDVMYVYIPDNVHIENGSLKYEDRGEVYDQVLRNQLYVLMTRAQSSLTIFAENSEVREYLTETIELINKKSDIDDVVLSPNDVEEIEMLKKQIADRKITKILHFTEEKNIPSIMEKGLLSVNKLEEKEIPFDRNDYQRLDGELGGVSLSIQKMNSYVLNDYKRKYPDKKYKLLVIDPAILYEIYSHEGNELAKRKYCQQNAAGNCAKSYEDFGILFPESVYIRNCDYYRYRDSELSNCPTDIQAEVLFFETIPPQYIKDVIDL